MQPNFILESNMSSIIGQNLSGRAARNHSFSASNQAKPVAWQKRDYVAKTALFGRRDKEPSEGVSHRGNNGTMV